MGACTCAFLPSCSSNVTLPFAWIKGSVTFPRGFPRGFPSRLFHRAISSATVVSVDPRLEIRGIAGKNSFPGNGLRHLGYSGNGGTSLEFLSPFLWKAPPLEMCRDGREIFPDHAGNGSLLSSYEAETGLLWMWVGLSCFLSSGDGYVGELLELQQGWEGPFGSLEVRCD